jgi:hypothetical protein
MLHTNSFYVSFRADGGIRPCPLEVWRRFSAPMLLNSKIS